MHSCNRRSLLVQHMQARRCTPLRHGLRAPLLVLPKCILRVSPIAIDPVFIPTISVEIIQMISPFHLGFWRLLKAEVNSNRKALKVRGLQRSVHSLPHCIADELKVHLRVAEVSIQARVRVFSLHIMGLFEARLVCSLSHPRPHAHHVRSLQGLKTSPYQTMHKAYLQICPCHIAVSINPHGLAQSFQCKLKCLIENKTLSREIKLH